MTDGDGTPSGFTLVEIVVALVILATGILALVGTAGVAARMVAQGGRYTATTQLAQRRIEQLRVPPCTELESGVSIAGDLVERWLVSPAGPDARQLTIVVEYRAGPRSRVDSFSALRLC